MASLPVRTVKRTVRRRLGSMRAVARLRQIVGGETFPGPDTCPDLPAAIPEPGSLGGTLGERILPRAGKGVRFMGMVDSIRRCADHRPPQATCALDTDAASVRRQAGTARP